MTTYLCFDFGMKRIGVAVGQTITKTASPVNILKATDGIPNWSQIDHLVQKYLPEGFVVGIPLNMDGSEQPLTLCARKFKNRLYARYKKPVHPVDERLSTVEVTYRIKDLTHEGIRKPKYIDDKAAVLLLEQWFAEQSE